MHKNSPTKYATDKRWWKAHPVEYTLSRIRWFTRHAAEMSEIRQKRRCRIFTVVAIRNGIIARPSCCQKCGAPCKPSAHHEDYCRILDVQFYCRKCHNDADKTREERLGIERAKPVRLGFRHYRRVYRRAMKLWRTGRHTQSAIGRRLGVSNSCVSKWVNGKTSPR